MLRLPSRASAPALTAGIEMDRRIWPMIGLVGLFGFIVVKEVSLPGPIIAIVGGLGLFTLLFAGMRDPAIPFYVLVAYLPFSRVLTGDFGTEAYAFNLTNILTAWVLIAYMLNRASKNQSIAEPAPMNVAVVLFCLAGTVSLIRAGMTYGSWYIWEYLTPLKRWLTPIFFYFLAFWVVRDRKVMKTTVVLIMAVMVVVAVMAMRDYTYVQGSGSLEKTRVGGIAQHSNTLGAFFVYYMFFFPAFFLVYPKKQLKIWMLLIPFLLCFRGIMVTFSRGAYLACAVGALSAAWFHRKATFFLALAAAIILFLNPWMLPPGIRYRVSMTVTDEQVIAEGGDVAEGLEASSANRIRIWRGALLMIKEHPMWGVGYGAFPGLIPMYVDGPIGEADAHNSYLLIASEMGIPTLLIFLLVFALAIWHTSRLYKLATDLDMKAIALGFLAGLCGMLVANMFGSRMDEQAVTSYFWMLCGLVMRGLALEHEAANPQPVREKRRFMSRTPRLARATP